MKKLDSSPVRQFTDRECAKVIGAAVGGLLTHCNPEDVLAALEFIVANWEPFESQHKQILESILSHRS